MKKKLVPYEGYEGKLFHMRVSMLLQRPKVKYSIVYTGNEEWCIRGMG